MKILEFHVRIMKNINISEFNIRIINFLKNLELLTIMRKQNENHRIPCENSENQSKHSIPYENIENNEAIKIQRENHQNHKKMKFHIRIIRNLLKSLKS